jgi:hypothetical protein
MGSFRDLLRNLTVRIACKMAVLFVEWELAMYWCLLV